MNNLLFLLTFFGIYFIPAEKLKNDKSIIDRYLGGLDYNNVIWYSKLKGKENPVPVQNRYLYEQEVEYNIGILKEESKIVFALKEYYGQYGMFTTAEKYYFDSFGNTFTTEYYCAHFQNGCNKNENSIHQLINILADKIVISKSEIMLKENGKRLDISRCENPFYEEMPMIWSVKDFIAKYNIK